MGDHRDRRDEQPRKIFLGGLSAATEEPSLRDYFGKFGEIDDCCVIRTSGPDQQKKSRGFGFVTFNSIACVDAVMAQRINGKLIIDGKDVEIKQAMSREDANENPSVTEKVYKVFIGGIGQLAQQQIQDYFSGYGEVKEVIVKNEDQKKRPYGFVIFEDHEVVDKIVVRKHNIDGQDVDCKKAAQRQGGQRGGQGGGGWKDNGGRGGGYQGGRGYGGDGGSYGGGNDYYGGAKSDSKDAQGGAYGGGSYGGSGGYGGGYGGASGGGYGGGYGGGATGGYGGSAGGYGGAGGYGAAGGYESGAGGYGGATGGDSSFGSGYGSQSSSYGPVRQSTGSGRYGGGQSSAPYGNYGSGSYGSGGSGGGAGGRRY